MTTPFLIETSEADGNCRRLVAIRSTDEAKDLRDRLWRNHELLAGDQMTPKEPRKWLLVQREMDIQDQTGAGRWSADLVFVDQDAIPTIVECKRRGDTRARREVIGQVFEYVANASTTWTSSHVKSLASSAAIERGTTLDLEMQRLGIVAGDTVDEFFVNVQTNLRSRKIRVVFFLDQCPHELIPLVEFWNDQMKDVEAFIVELRQYDVRQEKIVIPVLLGFTYEGEPVVPRSIALPTGGEQRTKWDEERFFGQIESERNLAPEKVLAIRTLESLGLSEQFKLTWGTGKIHGSFSLRIPSVATRSIISIYSNGNLSLNFGWLNESEVQTALRARLAEFAAMELGISLSEKDMNTYPTISSDIWVPKVDVIKSWLLKQALDEH